MIYETDDNIHCDTKYDTCSTLRPSSDTTSSFDVPVSSFAQTAVYSRYSICSLTGIPPLLQL